jgi:hypothetical protein
MRKTTALTLLSALAILSAVTTLIVTNASLPATEVERVKDIYYFRIHGQNVQNNYGVAEFIYKNLSPDTQVMTIIIDGVPKGGTLLPGDDPITGDFIVANGEPVTFRVEIENTAGELIQPVFIDTIWVPPNN